MSTLPDNAPQASVATTSGVHPVDEKLPLPRLFVLGLQHVLAMYAGAVAVPLIVGGAMVQAGRFDAADLHHLIVADLFVAGIASMIQSLGFWRFGSRLPLIQGVSFAAVSPMISIGSDYGPTAIYGSVICTGVMMILIAPVFSKIVKYFPPLVTGTIMVIIGLSLMSVPAGWIVSEKMSPELSGGKNFILAIITLAVVILVNRFSSQQFRSLAVLCGVVVGTIVAQFMGVTDWSETKTANWVGVPMPFQFGMPTFEAGAIITMCIVGLVIMTETAADIVAVGKITGRAANHRILGDGLRADGLSTLLGGVFNTFPYAAFAQNVGLVSLTRAFSRYIVAMSGLILLVLGLLPKAGAMVSAVPSPVLGGAGLALFGMVAVSGVRTLCEVEWNEVRALIVGVTLSIAMLPNVSDGFYDSLPATLGMILHSGIAVGAIVVLFLNVTLNRENDAHIDPSMDRDVTEADHLSS